MHRILKECFKPSCKTEYYFSKSADFAEIPKKKNPIQTWTEESKKIFSSFTRITISHWVFTCNNYRYASGRSSRVTMAGH